MQLTKNPNRVFNIGQMRINDEFQSLPFDKAYEFLAKKFPQVRHTQVFESDGVIQDDGSILYEVALIKSATNG